MKIVIVGAGEVGFHLAQKLSLEKHNLTLIDSDPEKCARVQEAVDVSVLPGSGSDPNNLREAGLESADMLIAASGIDEVNLIACMVASKLGVRRKVARVRNPEFYKPSSILTPQDLGVDLFIHPEDEVTDEIVRLLMRSAASEIVEFENGRILMVGVKLDANCPFINKQLKEIGTEEERRNFRIVAIFRGEKTIIPTGNEYIYRNDQIFVVTKAESLSKVLSFYGKSEQKLEKIMILGGGKIGRGVAQQLEQKDVDLTLVEANKEKSVQIAGQLKRTMVIHADGTDIDALAREGILDMDAFIATTSDDENNIIACLLAKHLGIQKTIALVNKTTYLPLLPVIGINSAVNLHLSTASAILRFVRRGEIVSVATFHGVDAEAIEFEIKKADRIGGKSLKKLRLPGGVLVAAIVREREILIPYGDSVIRPGDKVIAFALPTAIPSLGGLFT
jgi:trk system potassium uptake protein TrkA